MHTQERTKNCWPIPKCANRSWEGEVIPLNLKAPTRAMASTLLGALLFVSVGAPAHAAATTLKCSSSERCGGALFHAGYEPLEDSLVLTLDQKAGVSAIMFGEVWGAQAIGENASNKNKSSFYLTAPSGDIAMLSFGDDWQYGLSIHFSSVGETLNWVSTIGTCEVMN